MTSTRPTAPDSRSWRVARITTPVTRALAGRRFFPLWTVVRHTGRKTGRELSAPVAVRVTADAFVVTLPWGPGTNWVRNVVAAGGCVIRWKGADHRVTRPELIDPAQARPYSSRTTWAIVQRVIHAETFLLLHRQG
jgi:deazaflavin-dependent oxidoreductase (nitroreductase family)